MADTIKIGNIDVSCFKVGSSDCKIYLGDTLLYPQSTPPQYQYFTIRSLGNDNIITLSNYAANTVGTTNFSYSTNSGTTWTSFTIASGATYTFPPVLASGDTLMVKGNNLRLGSTYNRGHHFRATSDYEIEGNIMSLLNGDDTGNTFSSSALNSTYHFAMLFSGSTHLTSAENLVMATNNAPQCYNNLFRGATHLGKPPKVLSATTVMNGSYSSMFEGCTSLTEMPDILADTVIEEGMARMFCMNRTSSTTSQLTTLKPLHVTSMTPKSSGSNQLLSQMFAGNASLMTVPSNMLPATTVTNYCYYQMFTNCSSLTTAPVLPAITLASNCYQQMFSGCTTLNSITCLADNIFASNCTTNWVSGVASNGTFIKNSSMLNWTTGANGIPNGWNVTNYSG